MNVYMDVSVDDAVDMDVSVDDAVDMDVNVDDAICVTDKVFLDWGWSPVRSSCNTRYVYDGDPHNEFIIARCANADADCIRCQCRSLTMARTSHDDARFYGCVRVFRNHLDYFMKANRACQ